MEALLNLQHPGALSPLELRQAEVLFTLFSTSHSATRLGCCVMPNLSRAGTADTGRVTLASVYHRPSWVRSPKIPTLFFLVFLHPFPAINSLLSRNTH